MYKEYELRVFDHIWLHLTAPVFTQEQFGEAQWDARRSFDDSADNLAESFREVLAKAESLRLSAHRLDETLATFGIEAEVVGDVVKSATSAYLSVATFLQQPIRLRPKIGWEVDK